MYNHSNLSNNSTGSGSRRISSNNPFSSALLQEERQSNNHSPRNTVEDAQYNRWLEQRIDEEDDHAKGGYSSSDAGSFSEGDEKEFAKTSVRPIVQRASSGNSTRRYSNNPFTEVNNRQQQQQPQQPRNTVSSNSRSNMTGRPTERNNYRKNSNGNGSGNGSGTVKKKSDLPPPSYDEVVGHKYTKNEYPKDEKIPINYTSEDENPFPDALPPPRRSNTTSSRRGAPPPHPPSRLKVENMTTTTTTRIMSDGRIRSKSTGDPSRIARNNTYKRSSVSPEDPEFPEERHHHSSRTNQSSSHRSHSHSHRSRDREYEHERERSDRPHRSSSHRHQKKKFVQEKPKNLDTIDKLDVTGFFGGAKFHHDGPFDACTPHRNKDTRAPPVMAFPVDGPNNSIKGMGPNNTKEDQYDMMFGISKEESDPLYTAAYRTASSTSNNNNNVINTNISNNNNNNNVINSANNNNNNSVAAAAAPVIPSTYNNGVVVKNASTPDVDSIADGLGKTKIAEFDIQSKLHGDTTLGLGSSTFVDGAPAYGAKEEKKEGGLSRRKTLLNRVKSIKVSKKSS